MASDRSGRRGRSQGIFQRPVKTFEAHGLVVQEPKSKKYMLGPAIIELAGTKLAQDDLPQVSRRYLAQLSSETRETAHLATLYESEVLYLGGFKSEVQHLPPSKVSRCKAVHPEGINSSRQRTA
jgi:IclR family KDG regulon transcriptional repressor